MPRMARQRKTLTGLLQPLSRTAGPRGRAAGGGENPALEAIWHAVCTIPHGRVATYGGVARAAGSPGVRARRDSLCVWRRMSSVSPGIGWSEPAAASPFPRPRARTVSRRAGCAPRGCGWWKGAWRGPR